MKKLFLSGALLFLLAACASTKFTYVYKYSNYNLAGYKHLAILAMLPNNQARIEVEDAVQAAFAKKGIRALSTWSVFQFANDTAMMRKAGFVGEKRKEIIQKKITENQIDGLLIINLFDTKKEQTYVSGPTVGIGVSPGYGPYGYPYYGFYDYAYVSMSTPGYYTESSTYFVQSNLYDISTEKLVWTGQTSTQLSSSLQIEAVQFANLLVNKMVEDEKAQGTKK